MVAHRAERHVMEWPFGKRFAFTIFDDADSQTVANGKPTYDLLFECGLRTTKSVWPIRGPREPSDHGETCDEPHYLRWVKGLQGRGFEIGLHMATSHTSLRAETVEALDRFRDYFGHPPLTMANHYNCDENIYFGSDRLTGIRRLAYNVLTGFRNHSRFVGHVPGQPLFWGDICRQRIKYVRNFVFADINTLAACPWMPYHDPERSFVNYWFASSEGAQVSSFNERLSEENQNRLEAEGGACIMYTHFGLGFCEAGVLNRRFRELIVRLSRKNGWFVPVRTLLDYLLERRGVVEITPAQRAALEWRWLLHKVRYRTA
jgi:hypothetical protein